MQLQIQVQDTVSSKGGTVTYRITSIRRKLVNGKVVSTSTTSASCDIISDQLVNSSITFRLQIQYGVSSGDVREYIYTLAKGSAISRNTFAIQDGADPRVVDYGYSPQEDSKYIYSALSVI